MEPADLVVAGENCILLEKLAESLTWHLRLLNTGSVRARLYLEDGVADLACVSGPEAAGEGMALIWGFKRELGLVFRDAGALSDLAARRIVGWRSDSAMHAEFERHLLSWASPILSMCGWPGRIQPWLRLLPLAGRRWALQKGRRQL